MQNDWLINCKFAEFTQRYKGGKDAKGLFYFAALPARMTVRTGVNKKLRKGMRYKGVTSARLVPFGRATMMTIVTTAGTKI